MRTIEKRTSALCAALAFLFCGLTYGQEYPARRISFVVGYPPGIPIIDVPVRTLTEKLERRFNQPVTIENRPGAQGQIALEAVNKASPDGYTLGLGTIGLITLPLTYKPYTLDPITDFSHVGLISTTVLPNMLIASAKAPFKTLAEFVAYARANPGRVSLGGVGTSMQMEAALFAQRGGFNFTFVPYKSTTQVSTDLSTGDLHITVADYSSDQVNIEAGRSVIIAIGSRERLPRFPNVPTIAEAIPGSEIPSFSFSVIAPPKLPRAIINRLNEAIVSVMSETDVAPALAKVNMKPSISSPAEASAHYAREKERFGQAAALIGLKPQ